MFLFWPGVFHFTTHAARDVGGGGGGGWFDMGIDDTKRVLMGAPILS